MGKARLSGTEEAGVDLVACKTEDIDETIAKAQAIEDFNCDCYACISGSNKSCVR